MEFSTKDATDFAKQFEKQSGSEKSIFEKVFVHKYATPEATTAQALRDAVEGIQNSFLMDDSIKKDDSVILFFSSHGFLSKKNNRFRIIASDFSERQQDSRSLDFETEVLSFLNEMMGVKKLIFLDACKSGSAVSNFDEKGSPTAKSGNEPNSETLTKAIADLSQNNPGNTIMSSCGKGETSYEDKIWGNGVFTKALLEAFSNEEVEGNHGKIKGDDNGDGIIYLNELYDFTTERLPILLGQKDPKLKNVQKPYMPIDQLELSEKKPVFVLGGGN
ncbi:MAG: caspase family protein [Saprospiraceae bacterium]|nr:caspase family protein [Saprospiraceae bacterium]